METLIAQPEKTPKGYADLAFGSVDRMQSELQETIKRGLEKKKLEPEDLDGICGFGKKLPRREMLLPKTSDFMADPRKITTLVFGLASNALDLTLDDVNNFSLTPPTYQTALEEMKKSNLGVVAACGGDTTGILKEEQIRLFVMMRALEEIK